MRIGSFLLLCLLGLAPLPAHAQGVTRLTPTSPDFEDDFSAAVAVTEADDGTWALVGAPGDNDATGDAGSVFAYYRSEGGAWELQAQLFAPHDPPIFQGEFGSAIALEGRLAVVAETGIAAPGQAYVLRREGEGMASEWVVEAVLAPDSLVHPDHIFGVDVALDTSAEAEADGGFVAVVGALTRELLDPVPGAAHVFRRIGGGEWVEEAVLGTGSEEEEADQFGRSVAADAGRIAVGAFLDERTGGVGTGGAAYTFLYGDDVWFEEERTRPAEPSFFGADIDLEGRWMVVGATGEDCPAPDFFEQCGAAYFYKRTEAGWQFRHRFQPTDLTDYDLFGSAAALALPYAIVTAPLWDTEEPNNAGAAYLYRLDGNTWRFERLLRSPSPDPLDRFGRSVSLASSTALLGTTEGLGAAYTFDLAVLLPNEPASSQPAELVASVFPNPTVGLATLSFHLSEPAEVHVEVFDALGRVVWSHAARLGVGDRALRVETATWRPGLYLVRLRTSTGEAATTKFLRLGR